MSHNLYILLWLCSLGVRFARFLTHMQIRELRGRTPFLSRGVNTELNVRLVNLTHTVVS